jgi:zinc protease
VLVGDLDGQVALDRIRALFGPIPAGSPIPVTRRPEPQQRGERRIVREGEGSVAYLQAAYHAPQASAADFLPLMVMDAVLTGPASMSFSGDGAANRSSRLYKALIETELATDVGGSLAMTRDPYLYDLSVTVRSGHSLPEVEEALFAELDTLAAESISESELHKAVKQCKAQFAYATEQATNQAWWLGWAETVDGYTWFESFIERLARVTIDDVGIAARRCLAPANRTVGWYVPDPSQDEEQGSVVHID